MATKVGRFNSQSKAEKWAQAWQAKTGCRTEVQEWKGHFYCWQTEARPAQPKQGVALEQAGFDPLEMKARVERGRELLAGATGAEDDRATMFGLVSDLLDAEDGSAEQTELFRYIEQSWGVAARRVRNELREIRGAGRVERKEIGRKLRARLAKRGMFQFGTQAHDGYLGAHRFAKREVRRLRQSGVMVVCRHAERGDHWVLRNQMPKSGQLVVTMIYHRDRTGYWVEEKEGGKAHLPYWQVELRDPATGEVRSLMLRAISAKRAATRACYDVLPNFDLIDVTEVDAEWATAEEYDAIEAILADDEQDALLQESEVSEAVSA